MKCVLKVKTQDSDETVLFGERIGASLLGGEVLELSSDLGGGKTTLTKGIVKGLGSNDLVSSPTFTISNVYTGPKLTVHHYDFYRLSELGLMSQELQETMLEPHIVSIVEWAGDAHDLLPKDRLVSIQISPTADDENVRDLLIETDNESFMERLKLEINP